MDGVMISLDAVLLILIAHYMADFLFQTRWMATNKSSNFLALLTHVSVYTLVIGIYLLFFLPEEYDPALIYLFAVFNGFAHLVVDYISSRLSAYWWSVKRYDNFWYVIGFDQLLHTIILLSSFVYIMR